MRKLLLLGLTLLGAVALAVPLAHAQNGTDDSGGPKSGSPDLVVDYSGKLQDERAHPISGVFHLEFKLYKGENAKQSTWRERHFVAVVDGSYTVPLGTHETLEQKAIPDDAWIGVELTGEGELLRDRFEVAADGEDTADGSASNAKQVELSEATRELLEQAKDGDRIAYADIAERAVTADRADVAARAESLGDFSVDELEQKASLALERLGDHISDPDAHEATGGIRLGDDRKIQKRVGGKGGGRYEVNCPPGYVVTGITGGAGRLIDSIRIICTKLR